MDRQAELWNRFAEEDKEAFNKLREEVNERELKIYEETGRVPDWDELAGFYWEQNTPEIQHLKDIISKYEPGWE